MKSIKSTTLLILLTVLSTALAQTPEIKLQAYALAMLESDTFIIKPEYVLVDDADYPAGYTLQIHEGASYTYADDTVFSAKEITESEIQVNISVTKGGSQSNVFPLRIKVVQPEQKTFLNMSFEVPEKNWHFSEKDASLALMTYVSDTKTEGVNALKIEIKTPSEGTVSFRTMGAKIFDIAAGERYTVSFDMKANIEGKVITGDFTKVKNQPFFPEDPFSFESSLQWKRYSFQRAILDTMEQDGFGFRLYLPRDELCSYYLDNFVVEKMVTPAAPLDLGLNIGAAEPVVYVSPMGDDANVGSLEAPFKTVMQALSSPVVDTVYLLPGTYYEDVRIDALARTADKPLLITAKDKGTVLFEGVERFNYNWQAYAENENIYVTDLPKDVWQLFVDDKMMINARWPNADHPFEDFDNSNWWDRHASWCKGDKSGTTFGEINGELIGRVKENGEKGMAATGIDFNGKMGVLNVNSMESYAGIIYDYTVGTDSFNYQLEQEVLDGMNAHVIATVNKNGGHAYFFFENGLDLLDAPGEWYYDQELKKLYVYPRDGVDIANVEVSGKTQSFAFEVNNSSYVQLKGLNFFGTTVSFINSVNSRVEDCNFEYASYSKRILGDIGTIDHTQMVFSEKLKEDDLVGMEPTANFFINNEVCYTDGMAFHMTRGYRDTIDNNYFHHIDISGTRGGSIGVDYRGGYYTAFIRNTFEKGGGSAATKSANYPFNQFNRLSQFGYIQDDGCAFQVAGGGQIGSITTQNWIHNTVKAGMRFDGSEDEDPLIKNVMIEGTFVRNVVWDNPLGYMVKGDYHRVYNNVAFNNSATEAKILTSKFHDNANTHTVTRNNVMEDMSGSRNGTQFTDPVPGIVDHNWLADPKEYDIQKVLRDPYNLDFRPRENSALVDMGKRIEAETFPISGTQMPNHSDVFQIGDSIDIGAYEYGAEDYWIPGRMQPEASTPIPPNRTETAKTSADLMWLPAYRSTMNKVYFGTSSSQLEMISEQPNNICFLNELEANQTYFWRVDCLTPDGWVEGELWSFIAGGKPYVECGMPTSKTDDFTTYMGMEDYDAAPWKVGDGFMGEVHLLEDKLVLMQDATLDGANIWGANGMKLDVAAKIKDYPFLRFDYMAPDRESPFTFAIQVISNDNKSKRSAAKVSLSPASSAFRNKLFDLSPMIANWNSNYAAQNPWGYLEVLHFTLNPESSWIYANDGNFWIDNFKLGFAAIKEQCGFPSISAQKELKLEVNESYFISFDDLFLEVPYASKNYPWPKCETMPKDWELLVLPNNSYTLDGIKIIPELDFEGVLEVPMRLISLQDSSEIYMAQVIVGDVDLGLADLGDNAIRLYPNPTDGKVYFVNQELPHKVEVYTITGQLIRAIDTPTSSIDLSQETAGLYLVVGYSSDGDTWREKVILE